MLSNELSKIFEKIDATLLQMVYLCIPMSSFFKINLDFAGFLASLICAIHCIALPVFLSLGLANSNFLFHDHTFDIVIIGLGIVIASISLLSDYKVHKSKVPLSLIAVGFTILISGLKLGHDLPHVIMSVIGSTLVASAHYVNWKKGREIKRI